MKNSHLSETSKFSHDLNSVAEVERLEENRNNASDHERRGPNQVEI